MNAREGQVIEQVLILTCSTGEGHNSAAYAIRKALQKQNIECTIEDPVSFKSERVSRLVSSLYNVIIKKIPHFFGFIYKLGGGYCAMKLPSPVYAANAGYSKKLKTYIEENHYDVVICTHLYGMEAMTAIKKDENFKIPCYGVLTDYTCIPFFEETDLDGYFVPQEEQKQYMIKKGFRDEIITVSGIPVNESFRVSMDQETARRELHLPQNKSIFLIMTGGVGCENMAGLYDKLLSQISSEDMIVVLTGKNEKLKNKLRDKYAGNSQVKVVGFTRKVAKYMAAADVLLSKSGGLSSTEAAVANVPMVHVNVIPGCETCNAEFFQKHGMSVCAKNDREAVRLAKSLVTNKEASEKMRMNQREYIKEDAVDIIVGKVVAQ